MFGSKWHSIFCRQIETISDGIYKDSDFSACGEQQSEQLFRESVSSPFIGKPDLAYREAIRHHSLPVMNDRASAATKKVLSRTEDEQRLIIDLGCGFGWHWVKLAMTYPNINFLLIDFSLSNLMVCRSLMPFSEYPNVVCLLGDITSLPVRTDVSSLCWSVQVLQHLPEHSRRAAFKEIVRVTKPGGRFYIAWIRAVPAIKLIYALARKKYHLVGYAGQLYLQRFDEQIQSELTEICGADEFTYSEALFHPDVHFRPVNSFVGFLDKILSRSVLAPLIARQIEIQGVC